MLLRGIPETADEAHEIVKATAETTPNTQVPSHYPHSQVVALAQMVEHLLERIEMLEEASSWSSAERSFRGRSRRKRSRV